MTNDMIGLINLREDNPIYELNEKRPLATVPIGGKFRLIDFALSNMVNAGVQDVGLLLPANSRSILDHIRSGKEWGLARKGDGLFYLPLEPEEIAHPEEGDVSAYYKNLLFVKRGNKKYIVITDARTVRNIDYEKVLHFHRRHNADLTMVYQKQKADLEECGYALTVAEDDRITGITPKAKIQAGDNLYERSLIIDSEVFQHLIRRAYVKGYKNTVTDVLAQNIDRLRAFAYICTGFARRVSSLATYFQTNMDLLNPKVWQELFLKDDQHHIYTKIKDEAPAKYMEEARVVNSIIANGCVIEGQVENSILFRKVRVGRNTVIRNSIIMQHSIIGDNADLNYVVCDKSTIVQPEAILSGTKDEPLCISKRSVL